MGKKILSELYNDCKSTMLLPAIFSGIVGGLLSVVFMFSYASVIYVGPVSDLISQGAGYLILAGALGCILMALLSSVKGVISLPQSNPTAITAAAVSSIVLMLPEDARPEEYMANIAAFMIIASLATGAVLWFLGRFRLSNIVRYIPYSVIGGFLVASGWLLLKASIFLMGGVAVSYATIPTLFSIEVLLLWGGGVLYGYTLFKITKWLPHYLTLPVAIASGVLSFYILIYLMAVDAPTALGNGWLMEPIGSGGLWAPLPLSFVDLIDIKLVLLHAGALATVVSISAVNLLLNVTALEGIVQRDIDMNRELESAGITNLLVSALVSPVNLHFVSLSALSEKMGAKTRLVGVFAGLVCLTVLFSGGDFLSFFPKFILGGLLCFAAFGILYDWVFIGFPKLARSDQLVIVAIFVSVEYLGFLEGIFVGILIAMIVFIRSYSDIDVVHRVLSGSRSHGHVDRTKVEREALKANSHRIRIYELQGYLFFASSSNLVSIISKLVSDAKGEEVSYIILDFSRVTGIDTTAIHSFVKLNGILKKCGVELVYSGISLSVGGSLQRVVFTDGSAYVDSRFDDVDHALEYCEECILGAVGTLKGGAEKSAIVTLPSILNMEPGEWINSFEKYDLDKGDVLVNEGETSKAVYFVTQGCLTIMHYDGSRVRKIRPGAIFGAASCFQTTAHEALTSVVADSETCVWGISEKALYKLSKESPNVFISILETLNRHLADRVSSYISMLDELR
ncbi:MAG: SulP family inorganic anion transporter [Pseudomonadales bacterium]